MSSRQPNSRGRAKHELITLAARELFLAHGYAGTSMGAVTAAAGVSKQTVYNHFAGKVALLIEVISHEVDKLGETARSTQPPNSLPELREALLRLVRELTDRLMTTESLALFRLIIGEASRLPEVRTGLRGEFAMRLLTRIEGLIRGAVDRGLIVAARPDLNARMLLGPVFSFVMLDGVFLVGEIHRPDQAALEYIVDGFLNSVAVNRS